MARVVDLLLEEKDLQEVLEVQAVDLRREGRDLQEAHLEVLEGEAQEDLMSLEDALEMKELVEIEDN